MSKICSVVCAIERVSVSPQIEQVRVSSPSAAHVAGVVTIHSPKTWSVVCVIGRVSVSPQIEQVRVSSPAAAQVA